MAATILPLLLPSLPLPRQIPLLLRRSPFSPPKDTDDFFSVPTQKTRNALKHFHTTGDEDCSGRNQG
jgi:hypothetical protein